MYVLRRALAVLTVLGALMGASLIGSAPAQAATSCSGTITYRGTVDGVQSDEVIGELVIYYNSSNGGTNSACLYRRGAAYGVAGQTYVYISRCAQQSGEGETDCDVTAAQPDKGTYSYYAGPVGVTGTANYCVLAGGWLQHSGLTYSLGSGRQGC